MLFSFGLRSLVVRVCATRLRVEEQLQDGIEQLADGAQPFTNMYELVSRLLNLKDQAA